VDRNGGYWTCLELKEAERPILQRFLGGLWRLVEASIAEKGAAMIVEDRRA
jgi:hypothetical protein